jgi:AcrR family transcriptional regulator
MPPKRKPVEVVQPRRPRGRPKAEDLAGLDARLLAVGGELFFRHGYGAMTMSELATAARVSKTTLYARFPSKADLFRAIVASQMERWDTGSEHTPIEGCETLGEVLQAYGDIVLRAGMDPDFVQLNRLLYSESERFPELAEIADLRFQRGVVYLAEQIRIFAERERQPCRDPEGAAELFLLLLTGKSSMAALGARFDSGPERKAWLEVLLRKFLGGRSAW